MHINGKKVNLEDCVVVDLLRSKVNILNHFIQILNGVYLINLMGFKYGIYMKMKNNIVTCL